MPAELSATAVAALPPRKTPHWVSPLLYICKIRPPGSWSLIYVSPTRGRRVEMGLGPVRDPALAGAAARASGLSLIEAKAAALEFRAQILRGRCPLSERRAEQEALKAGQPHRPSAQTFAEVAEAYIALHRAGWSNKLHAQQWATTLQTYAYPVIGAKPVARVDTDDILAIIEPIWISKTETASRVRGRVESILDYARSRKWIIGGDNPARWRGHLENLLPKKSRVRPVVHQAAMDWRELPRFYQALMQDRGTGSLLLQYLICTVLRTTEARLATIGEIDRDQGLHLVPGPRTKMRQALRVPLSTEARRILDAAETRRTSDYLFGGRGVGKPLSDRAAREHLLTRAPGLTVHGFRSSFRDWCADAGVERELAEASLGHAISSRTEASYLRSDVLERRRALMQRWAQFLTSTTEAEVVDLKREATRRAG